MRNSYPQISQSVRTASGSERIIGTTWRPAGETTPGSVEDRVATAPRSDSLCNLWMNSLQVKSWIS